ncbi:MAG: hypothetical protein ACI90V_002906 [Bacillariaceae sp.]|jgi:hypothetical protein
MNTTGNNSIADEALSVVHPTMTPRAADPQASKYTAVLKIKDGKQGQSVFSSPLEWHKKSELTIHRTELRKKHFLKLTIKSNIPWRSRP